MRPRISTPACAAIRERTGCSVIAVKQDETMKIVPGPGEVLPAGSEMLLIGTLSAEEQFFSVFKSELAPV